MPLLSLTYNCPIQCCGAGAGGAEIILGPVAGAEKIYFNKHFLQSVWSMLD